MRNAERSGFAGDDLRAKAWSWSFSTASIRAPATRATRRWARASAWPRTHLRIEAYGTVDETNADCRHRAAPHQRRRDLRQARCHAGAHPERSLRSRRRSLRARYRQGSGLRAVAHRAAHRRRGSKPRSTNSMPSLQPLRSFVLPGGHPAAAHLHLCRTVCRRAERLMVDLEPRSGRDGVASRRSLSSTGCPISSSSRAAG